MRDRLPLATDSVDAVFAHMLPCVALFTDQIHPLVSVRSRVLRPGRTLVYTMRRTGDPHYGTGTFHGDDVYVHGGFAVHSFPCVLVDDSAADWPYARSTPSPKASFPGGCGASPKPRRPRLPRTRGFLHE